MGKGASGTRIITRGNVDGIVCAAVFLERFPEGEVTFISSPPSAARAAAGDVTSTQMIIADVPLNEELLAIVDSDPRITLVDHHPSCADHPRAFVDRTRSAAGVLHDRLGAVAGVASAVALADLYERSDSKLLARSVNEIGRERTELEARILDFAWRCNVADDAFRLVAARELSRGLRPSECEAIMKRYGAVMNGDRWAKAVRRVRDRLEVRGGLAILDLRRERPSLHGFGAMALAQAARERGCGYAMLVHDSGRTSIASLRACGGTELDLGLFVQKFAVRHGAEGGGHHASAGVRVPREAADLLIDELTAAVG
jgi:hypothetical protein